MSRRHRVLLAEDDRHFRALLAACLRRLGYEVVEARDGVELLGRIEATARACRDADDGYAAIVADNQMPGLDGLDVLGVLGRAQLQAPFILITGFVDDETRAEARARGAAAVLEKPFSIDELESAIQKAVAQRQVS